MAEAVVGTRGRTRAPPWQHPLLGSGPGALLAGLRQGGGVSPSRVPDLAAALVSGAMRWPFRVLERRAVTRRAARFGEPPPPIFLVGHWRSGTTHAYNVLSHDPQFVYPHPLATGLPQEFVVLGGLLRPFLERLLPRDRWVDALAVTPESPQEDEVAMANLQTLSFLHAVYYPRRFRELLFRGVFFHGCSDREVERWQRAFRGFLRTLWLSKGRGTLLIKNPAHTARVEMLSRMYPGARFIHVRRNPYDVFRSSQRFWRVMLDRLAWQSPGAVTDQELEEVVLDVYARMMSDLLRARERLPAHRFVEVGLEEMEASPMATVEKIYRQLEIEGFEQARGPIERYFGSIGSYRKRSYSLSPQRVSMIDARWAPFLEEWGYEVPA